MTSARFHDLGKYPSEKHLLYMLARNWGQGGGSILRDVSSMRSSPGDLLAFSQAMFCATSSGVTGSMGRLGGHGLSRNVVVAPRSSPVFFFFFFFFFCSLLFII